MRAGTATATTAYGILLTSAASFKYIGRVLSASDDDWPAVVRNLRGARQKWARLSRVLGREGEDEGGSEVLVRDVGNDTAHWEGVGRIPPQGGPQTDGTEISEVEGWEVGVPPSGGSDGGIGVTGGGDLHLPPPEHSFAVHCNRAHYGPVSGGGEASGVTGGQAVVGTGRLGLGWDADGGS